MSNIYSLFKENINILIIMTYVYILYAFDFSDKHKYLLGITLLTMYIMHQNTEHTSIEGLTGSSVDFPTGSTASEREAEVRKRIELRELVKKCENKDNLTEEELQNCRTRRLSVDEENRVMGLIKGGSENFLKSSTPGKTGSSTQGITGSSTQGITGSSTQGITGSSTQGTTGSSTQGITPGTTPSSEKLEKLEDKINAIQKSLTQWYPWSNAEVKLASITNEIRSIKMEEENGDTDNQILSSLLYSKPDSVDEITMYDSIGKYDNICMKDMGNTFDDFDEEEHESSNNLSLFLNNRVSVECCEDSAYSTSNGCICLTNNQKDKIFSRAGNK